MNKADYAKGLKAYYNHPDDPVHLDTVVEKVRELDAQFAQPGHWRRQVALAIRRALRGRRVLEIACGRGLWTRFLVDVADYVLATDASPRLLTRAKEIVPEGKKIKTGRLRFLRLDAYDLEDAPGEFDAVLAMNWFEHVPFARHDEFLNAIQKKLGPNGVVFIGMIRFSAEQQACLFTKRGEPDFYSLREHPDGSQFEVIDNVFSKGQLHQIFAPRSRDLRFRSGKSYYWITYKTPKKVKMRRRIASLKLQIPRHGEFVRRRTKPSSTASLKC